MQLTRNKFAAMSCLCWRLGLRKHCGYIFPLEETITAAPQTNTLFGATTSQPSTFGTQSTGFTTFGTQPNQISKGASNYSNLLGVMFTQVHQLSADGGIEYRSKCGQT
ncbi:hypothetical protein C0J52_23224 [Blattella germanica]|nr:hypothetical protein C0J52_23224 [Blattella germanica]